MGICVIWEDFSEEEALKLGWMDDSDGSGLGSAGNKGSYCQGLGFYVIAPNGFSTSSHYTTVKGREEG